MSDTIWQTDLVLTAREKEMEGEKKMEKKKMQDRNSIHFKLIWPGSPGIIKQEQEWQRRAILSSSVYI